LERAFILGSITLYAAVVNRTRKPFWQTAKPSASAKGLAVPEFPGPNVLLALDELTAGEIQDQRVI
jgi:hypothetical protein